MKTQTFLMTCLLAVLFFACGKKEEATGAAAAYAGPPAVQKVSALIEKTPTDASLYAQRGGLWYENENYDEAIADIEKAIAMDSTKAEYFHVLSDVYMDYYKSRQALGVMQRAAMLFPKRVPTLLKLAEYQLILKNHNEALLTLERIRVIEPFNAEMFFMFGNVFTDMGKTDQAITAYQSAVENDAKLTDAWIKLANLLADKNMPQAAAYYDNALRSDSLNIEALHAKAYYLSNKKDDLKGALKLYKKINVIDQQYADGYYNAGLLYLDMDSVQQAYGSFDLAVKFAPTFAEAYFHRGLAAEKKGDPAQARGDYENVLRLQPDFEGAKDALQRLKKQG